MSFPARMEATENNKEPWKRQLKEATLETSDDQIRFDQILCKLVLRQ